MKKIILNLILISFLLLIVSQILTKSEYIISSILVSFDLWKCNVFPSLFPFFVVSSLLINYGFVELLSELFKPIMRILFKSSGNSAFIFIMSIISGIPSNSKYINELLEKNMINIKEAEKLLMFTHFSNPLFILGTVGTIFLNNYHLGVLILFSHYISNIIIGIFIRNYNAVNNKEKTSIKKALLLMINKSKKSKNFIYVITNIIKESINSLLIILGIITFFIIITTIINNTLYLNNISKGILSGIFEITQGLKYVSILNLNIRLKAFLCTILLSFGGLSAHMQVMGILNNKKIRYYPYLLARIIHSILSGIIILILTN